MMRARKENKNPKRPHKSLLRFFDPAMATQRMIETRLMRQQLPHTHKLILSEVRALKSSTAILL
jgi:hypothetical protein